MLEPKSCMKLLNKLNGMKVILLGLNLLFIGVLWGQFYPVPETDLNFRSLTGNMKKQLDLATVKPMSMSGLITVREFKIYLESVKKDSGVAFYQSQIPNTKRFSNELANELLSSEQYLDLPIPGISWKVARNYCRWLTKKAHEQGLDYTYDLPHMSELLAYEQIYTPNKSNDELLESWTLTAYDESVLEYAENSVADYTYDAREQDPPSMKRKWFYGRSFHANDQERKSYYGGRYEYQDSSSRYIGFRIVRKSGFDSKSLGKYLNMSTKDQKAHGIYSEFYANNKIKVLGEFYNGQRVGMWSVWDSTGNLLIRRHYTSNTEFEFIYPVSDHPYKQLYAKYPDFVMKRNVNNNYEYEFLSEREYVYSKRLYRQLNVENEKELFSQINLKQILQDLAKTDVKWYHYGKNCQFKELVTDDELKEMKRSMDAWDYSKMETKEDFFFSSDNLMGDARQIGLSFYKNKTDEKPSYSLYYPEIRQYLAKYKIKLPSVVDIQHLDDVFYFNQYRGQIVKETNIHDRDAEEKDDWKIELSKLKAEHNLWISYGR